LARCTGEIVIAAQPSEPRYNERIRAREVRLIGPDGSQVGIRSTPDALTLARELDLDLVEVAPLANPPVCRIMDYGKFRYEEAQKAKEARRKTSHVTIKEVKFRPKIGKGDFDTKVRHMRDFLLDGHKVKVTLQFRGREVAHPELGSRILDAVLEQLGELAKVETQARLEGRNMTMVLSPDKKPSKKTKDSEAPSKDVSAQSKDSEVQSAPPSVEATEAE
jgi:translation initiation factor IF-3